MGSGASSDQPTSRVPQPPQSKAAGGRTSAKKSKNDAPEGKSALGAPATAKKDFTSISAVANDGSDAGAAPTPISKPQPPPQAPITPTTTATTNYAMLLQQHQQQQLTNGLNSGVATNNVPSAANQSNTGANGAPATSSQPQAPANAQANAAEDILGKKATFRQVIKRALELAQEQRQRYGKFRKDEKRAVMELYETLGLDEDTFLAPPNELQKRIANYRFPPPNMHMLKDMQAIDEETLEYTLGTEEAKLRKSEGLEVVPVAQMKRALDVEAGSRRVGVSSEGTQALLRSNPMFKSIPKNKDQGDRLWAAIQHCALFRVLDSSDMKILFAAFEMERFDSNTSIFDQGDEGDKFYLIDSGRCHVVVKDPQGREIHSVFLGEGDTFGELAIMYGTPRAATVTAVIDMVCWWIDRDTYRGTLLKETIRKRDKYIKFLESVPLFQNVDAYEKARIADVLEVVEVTGKGSTVIREGESGDTFYLIEEGEVKFETAKDGEVFERRKQGSFFGEMALLFDRPRMATVITTTPLVRLLTLNRSNFTGYLGPLDEILRRNAEQYKHYVAKAQNTGAA